jgi:hypothetical protein
MHGEEKPARRRRMRNRTYYIVATVTVLFCLFVIRGCVLEAYHYGRDGGTFFFGEGLDSAWPGAVVGSSVMVLLMLLSVYLLKSTREVKDGDKTLTSVAGQIRRRLFYSDSGKQLKKIEAYSKAEDIYGIIKLAEMTADSDVKKEAIKQLKVSMKKTIQEINTNKLFNKIIKIKDKEITTVLLDAIQKKNEEFYVFIRNLLSDPNKSDEKKKSALALIEMVDWPLTPNKNGIINFRIKGLKNGLDQSYIEIMQYCEPKKTYEGFLYTQPLKAKKLYLKFTDELRKNLPANEEFAAFLIDSIKKDLVSAFNEVCGIWVGLPEKYALPQVCASCLSTAVTPGNLAKITLNGINSWTTGNFYFCSKCMPFMSSLIAHHESIGGTSTFLFYNERYGYLISKLNDCENAWFMKTLGNLPEKYNTRSSFSFEEGLG